jgi:hypothetical protein
MPARMRCSCGLSCSLLLNLTVIFAPYLTHLDHSWPHGACYLLKNLHSACPLCFLPTMRSQPPARIGSLFSPSPFGVPTVLSLHCAFCPLRDVKHHAVSRTGYPQLGCVVSLAPLAQPHRTHLATVPSEVLCSPCLVLTAHSVLFSLCTVAFAHYALLPVPLCPVCVFCLGYSLCSPLPCPPCSPCFSPPS